MPSLLNVVTIGVLLVLVLILVFIVQSSIAPRLLAGSLSNPARMLCNDKNQWLVYSCKPNPITGIGCIVPNSNGRYITSKSVAVHVTPCLPPIDGGDYSGERVISLVWQEQGEAKPCASPPLRPDCCEYNGECFSIAKFLCIHTDQGLGGENQCLPQFLPAPFELVKGVDYLTTPAVVNIPCKMNYCGSVALIV